MLRCLACCRAPFARFMRDTAGASTLEFVLWIPLILVMFATLLYFSHSFTVNSTMWNQARIAARGRNGQGDKLAHPHSGGVEHLHHAGVAQPVRIGPPMLPGRVQQAFDVVLGQRLWQASGLARPGDAQGRVVGTPAFLERETVDLLDRG